MLAQTREKIFGIMDSRRFVSTRRGRQVTTTLVHGFIASLLLTTTPAYAGKGEEASGVHVQQKSTAASRTIVSQRTVAPQRLAALRRRGRAFAQAIGFRPLGSRHDKDEPASNVLTPAAAANQSAATGEVLDSGIASWYSVQHNGTRTSSGERFDENAMTAAHNWLPLGTRVRVTVVGTNASVVVTINDRQGTRRRVIDLSKGAARELGILGCGIARVTLTRS